MADWNDLKKAFENELNKQEKKFMLDEQSLLETIARHLAKTKGLSALQGYDTDEMLAFLAKPIAEIKKEVGGPLASFDEKQLDSLIYSLTKKVQKSASLLNGGRK